MAFKKTFLISDESLNSHKFWTRTEGIDLSLVKKNCPCFYDHRTWEIPLGHWENHRIENGKWFADLLIDGANDEEKEYIRKIENKDLQCASYGADPIEWKQNMAVPTSGEIALALWNSKPFEISLLPLPSNENSIALRNASGLVKLSATNIDSIIPLLKPETNMKAIALKLGLPETATETDILTAIGAVQLAKSNAEAFNANILAEAQKDLSDDQKAIFVTLSKTDPAQAMAFIKLSKPTAGGDVPPAAAGGKPETIANLIRAGKETGGSAVDAVGKDSFDYLQRHNPLELNRMRNEEPAKYAQLAKDYQKGVRYKG